jgi:phospholipid/cholesterol/gamma-HCH transport system substrate-binding protein
MMILGTAVFLIGRRQFLFSPTYALSASFKTVAGLIPGAEVRVGGMNRGTVSRIELPRDPAGDLTVVMKLDRSTQDVVRQDSVATIETDGLLGDKHVAVSFGSPDADRVADGAHITGEPTMDLSDVVKRSGLVMGDLQATAGTLKDIGAKINSGQGTIGSLVNDRKLYDQLQAAATGLQDNMDALKHNFLLKGFFSQRGYEDSTDLARHEIPALPRGPYAQRVELDGQKLFSADSAKLKQTKVLDEAGHALEGRPFGLAVVVARGGLMGDSEELRVLARARAMNVRDYLVRHFAMDDTRLKTVSLAKAEDAEKAGVVEIVIYPDTRK